MHGGQPHGFQAIGSETYGGPGRQVKLAGIPWGFWAHITVIRRVSKNACMQCNHAHVYNEQYKLILFRSWYEEEVVYCKYYPAGVVHLYNTGVA